MSNRKGTSTTKYIGTIRIGRSNKTSNRGVFSYKNLITENKQSSKIRPTCFGGTEVKILDQFDKSNKKKRSRSFVFESANKPKVTIVDYEPDTPGIIGTLKVDGVSYSLILTHEQINEAYGAAISSSSNL